MAGDSFTQIANALFRDAQLSFKAKGLFGYVSTHRNGWQVTIADLVRLGPDGREAVRTALKELEAHGYLIRERLRRPDGTLGEIVYCITDRPATLDLALIEADVVVTAPETDSADGFGAGIRRGVMAGDSVHPDRQRAVPRRPAVLQGQGTVRTALHTPGGLADDRHRHRPPRPRRRVEPSRAG